MAASGKSITVNINDDTIRLRIPNRCRRCWHYKDDPQLPSLQESLMLLLFGKDSDELRLCHCFVLAAPFAILSSLFIYLMKTKSIQEVLEWSLLFLPIFPAVMVAALVAVKGSAMELAHKYSRKMDFQNLMSQTKDGDELPLL
ncbi:uncharacterized protein [Procambarus clarkii]|uniref:uncharacterized protein n=1 Tax=Procambarus clarkii TaxID=6728 RepID=UPI001E676E1C|nr:uncharacterized protein LOC123757729 [Procambarus clarkii]